MESATHPHHRSWNSTRLRDRLPDRLRALPLPRPELAVLLGLAALLYLWALSRNGWANDYYSAAVRSMAGSWHDFLYGSFDAKGLMTVDKPPLALWVEALSVKVFGFNSLAILVPQALMGVASVGLLYDLTRRRFGRAAGALAGLTLALTPVVVAISRHNNPDALLVLCSVGALWCFVRALDRGATKWLVLAGVCVGLGFEAKMGAALMIVPGMALAWLWVAPRGRAVAIRQLAFAGAALLAVALAWPVIVWLTPSASRPWISGTSDNSIWSLIWEYNGFGRLEGQTGGPGSFGGAGGGPFGGATGAFRLLNEALGGQAGWFLGTAAVGGIGIAALSRLRRADPRTGWIIAVGGAFVVTAIAFSFAGGIFHPYYTSLLAPFAAALVGATFGQVIAGERLGEAEGSADRRLATVRGDLASAASVGASGASGAPLTRILGAAAIGAGAIVELVVIGNSATDLGWLVVPLVLVAVAAVGALLFADKIAPHVAGTQSTAAKTARIRLAALACGFTILMVGPAIWSVDTLGHPTSGTFPAGGPESASMMGGIGGPPGGVGGQSTNAPGQASGETGAPPSMSEAFGGNTGGPPSMGEAFGGSPSTGEAFGGAPSTGEGLGGAPSMGGGTAGGAGGGMFGGEDLTSVLEYTEAHGGGTIAVDSQSGAAASIIESGAEVAGIGGFSGKESSVSAAWLEERIESGAITWIYTSGLGGGTSGGATMGGTSAVMPGGESGGAGVGAEGGAPLGTEGGLTGGRSGATFPFGAEGGPTGGKGGFTGAEGGPSGAPAGGDTRTGSESAIDTVVKSCTKVESSAFGEGGGTLYKCG
jgi:4-amino-4-deoxy-L-arabinose transferase-like glycosyltransferase